MFTDNSLIGHSLTSLPKQLWDYSNAPIPVVDFHDPLLTIEQKNYTLCRFVTYRQGNVIHCRNVFYGEFLLWDTIEFVSRRILAKGAALISLITLAPIGFSAKMIHKGIRKLRIRSVTLPLVQPMITIWNDKSLYGHALTSMPSACYTFAAAHFTWHERSDGTDRRGYYASYSIDKKVIEHLPEYQFVPFELFEFITRRICGSTATIVSSLVSPVGLLIKCVHRSLIPMRLLP